MKKRYTEEQIIGFLREADAGLPVKELCRKHGFSEPSYYAWKANPVPDPGCRQIQATEVERGNEKPAGPGASARMIEAVCCCPPEERKVERSVVGDESCTLDSTRQLEHDLPCGGRTSEGSA